MNKEKYLAKIKKLLNLARKTSNANEAANAISMAQSLMRQYNISEVEAGFCDISEACSKGAPSDASRPPNYMGYLVQVVSQSFGVRALFTWRYDVRRLVSRRCVRFYGPGSRPEVAAYAFDVLSRQMIKARKEFIASLRKGIKTSTKTARADLFCEGWVNGVWQVLDAFNPREEEETLMEAYRTHLRNKGDISESRLRKAGNTRGGSDDAVHAGYESGMNARLSHGVNGAASASLAIGRT